MNLEHIGSFSIPEWALPALECGDYSGLTNEEDQQVNQFAADYPLGEFAWHFEMIRHFSKSPAFGLPCDCVDLLIYEIAREEIET